MNKFNVISLLVVLSFVLTGVANAASTIGANMSTTGTFTQTVGSATAARFQNAAGTITVLQVDTTNTRVGVGAAPSTTFEVQGTASASYFFTLNSMQVAGVAATVAYSRFGVGTTGDTTQLDAANDLLITGALEVDGKAFFDGTASVAGNFEVSGTASISGVFSLNNGQIRPGANSTTAFRFQNAAGTTSVLTIDTSNSRVGIGGTPGTTFEVQGTASASYFLTGNTIQVGGFASVAYSRFGTAATGYSTEIDTTNDLLISGSLELDGNAFFDGNASVAGSFELTGNTKFGINAGAVTQTTLEVGGTASISGIASVSGNFAAGLTNTGTSSFNFDAPSTSKGGCFRIKDNDGSGYTYLRVTNGTGTFSTVDCR